MVEENDAARRAMQATATKMAMADLAVIPVHVQAFVVATRNGLDLTMFASGNVYATSHYEEIAPRPPGRLPQRFPAGISGRLAKTAMNRSRERRICSRIASPAASASPATRAARMRSCSSFAAVVTWEW